MAMQDGLETVKSESIMKKWLFIIVLSLSVLCVDLYVCYKYSYIEFFRTVLFYLGNNSFYDKSFLSDDRQDLSDELMSALNAVDRIVIYAIPQHFAFPSDTDFNAIPLTDEETIRREGSQFIFRQSDEGEQYYVILMMLYSAPQVAVSPVKNRVTTVKLGGLEGYKEGGMVFDIIAENRETIATYIMQNGLPVFYEKGKEGVYYKMPKVLLDKFSVSLKEFVDTVRHKKLNTLPHNVNLFHNRGNRIDSSQ